MAISHTPTSTTTTEPRRREVLTPERLRTVGNTAGPLRRPLRPHTHGAPLLDARPFLRWLADHFPENIDRLPGEKPGTTSRSLRRVICDGQERISELIVERVGIMLDRDPELARTLYPELAEPVCAICRAARGCKHLVGQAA